jgi:DNA-binding transcriptional MerR regulator
VQLRLRCARTEYRIGEVAIRAGVSVEAVRYYERLKLLPRARRTSGRFRVFGVESRWTRLRTARDRWSGRVYKRVNDLLNEKLHELDARLRSMKEFRRVLVRH